MRPNERFVQLLFKKTSDDVRYYEGKLPGLGKRFRNEVKYQLMLLKQNPHTRSIRYEDVRLATIAKFPYSIHYTIHEMQVMIHAVLCDYRNPTEYWVR